VCCVPRMAWLYMLILAFTQVFAGQAVVFNEIDQL
jgi:hypothetical protein